MIIIEGMDNSGKTTLVNYLASEIPCEMMRSPGPNTPEFLASWVMIMIQRQASLPVLFDRFPVISEAVYGTVLRGKNALDLYGDRTFTVILKALHPLIIYCRPPFDRILDFEGRDQMVGVKEKALILVDKYDYLMDNMRKEGFTIITYDYTSQSLTRLEVLGMVKNHFRRSFLDEHR